VTRRAKTGQHDLASDSTAASQTQRRRVARARQSASAAERAGTAPGRASADQDQALLQLARLLKESGYRFITVTPATHARVNARPGNEWARTLEDVLGWSRPFREHVVPAPVFALMQAADVIQPWLDGWSCEVRFSNLCRQLFLHSAHPTQASDAVFFGPDTWRFAAALDRCLCTRQRPVLRALDLGTGAGPGAILIATAHPGAEVIAADINPRALRFTGINAALADSSNVVPLQSDLMTSVEGSFDLIISNPPYLLDADERTYRHGGGGLGEGVSLQIVGAALDRLNPGGTLLLYTGSVIVDGHDRLLHALHPGLERLNVAWAYEELDPDIFGEELLQPAYAQADRIAAVLLTATRPDADSH